MPTRALAPAPKGFHGDRYLLRLVDRLAARAGLFLETGANVGSTLGYVARRYPTLPCLSCEPDPTAAEVAERHACTRPGVELLRGTSQELLATLAKRSAEGFARPLLAWLDAHGYGFEWPLRDEVRFLTERFDSGCLLIDDFKVPHDSRFGFDAYGDAECSFDYIRAAIAPHVAWRLYYPAYAEHTSPWHPLRGWGVLQFGRDLEALERLDRALPDVCQQAASHAPARTAGRAAPHAPAPTTPAPPTPVEPLEPNASRTIESLRGELARDPTRVAHWNELGAALLATGDREGARAAFAEVLCREPRDATARNSWRALLQAQQPAESKPLPIAPGAWGRMVRRDPFADLRDLCTVERPTIVDGGANRGDTVERLRTLFPDAMVHAFEPLPALADAVRARFPTDERLVVHRAALAAHGGTLAMKRMRSDPTSSTLTPSALARRYQGARVDVVEELEVLALPLADAVAEPIDVLKLDLQGGELAALRGLGGRLAEVRLLLTEVEFAPLYDGQPLFSDVEQYLRKAGFRLFHLYDLWSHPDGQVTAGDALFVNTRFYS